MNDTALRMIYIIDDDPDVTASLALFLEREGYPTSQFNSGASLLRHCERGEGACLISDVRIGEENGFALAQEVRKVDPALSLIFMTGWPCTTDAVDAIKLQDGVDYLEKPLNLERLVAAVEEAVQRTAKRRDQFSRLECLTRREREVFDLLVKGHTTKSVAQALALSPRTIEDYRAQIFLKSRATTLSELFALAEE